MDVRSGWKGACAAIFGEELGELEDYRQYLLELHYPCISGKSSVSGKEVALSGSRYCDGARIISQDEVDFERKFAPFSINELKDIDSVLGALSDRFYYCGNKTFGNSKFVEGSDNCDDSFYVLDSHTVVSSKYVAYSSFVRAGSSFIYGGVGLMGSSHIIRGSGANNSRNFESFQDFDCSDMFFTFQCSGCLQCMFSFNLRSKRYAIGNLELEKGKYLALRGKLAGEVAESLRKNKSFRSIYDFAAPMQQEIAAIGMPRFSKKQSNQGRLEEAFRRTAVLVLGSELGDVKNHEKFLSTHTPEIRSIRSPFGNVCCYSDYFLGRNMQKERMISTEEAAIASKAHISVEPGDNAKSIMEKAGAIAFFSAETSEGQSGNNSETPVEYNAHDNYRVAVSAFSRRSAYCAHIQYCDAIFGSGMLMVDCSFCIRCHNCVKVTCSMDMDSCTACARSMFCHNCENVNDSLFCFNTKNKTYAVGNVEVGRENYLKIRKMVIDAILRQIEKNGVLGIDVCSLGCLQSGGATRRKDTNL